MQRVLGMFAKRPEAGAVKSRLAAVIGPEWAARLYGAFLRDLVARLATMRANRVIAYAPADAHAYFTDLAAGQFRLVVQAPGSLGDRMAGFFSGSFQSGAERVVLIGSDSPDLPLGNVSRAFEELADHDVVLGPSDDGGYYLIGMRRMIPEVFQDIRWSTSNVRTETIERLRGLGIAHALLEAWYDVDVVDDLERLSHGIDAARRIGTDRMLEHTAAALDAIRQTGLWSHE